MTGPAGQLVITLQGSVWTTSVVTPSVKLNGVLINAQYGDNVYTVPAGQHRIEIHQQWIRQYGQADIVATVPENGSAQVFYATPWHQFTTGSIGYERQSKKGVGFLIGLIAFLVLVVLSPVLIAIALL
ncbi:MAG: hypothetical protein ACK5LS_12450 [Propioniciclava sp.]